MIDLDQIGYNVIQKDEDKTTEITGGITLTVRIKVSSLAPDPEALALHARKRIREKIWEMAYGHLAEALHELRESVASGLSRLDIREKMDKLEEELGEPWEETTGEP